MSEKRIRPRTGYVMVELTADERAKLEALRDDARQRSGLRANLSSVFRDLLRKAPWPRKNISRNSSVGS